MRNEIAAFLWERTLVPSDDPLKEWKLLSPFYSIMSIAARKMLCIPVTSVPYEKLFFIADDLVTKKRNKLTLKYVNQVLFINQNYNLFNWFKYVSNSYTFK